LEDIDLTNLNKKVIWAILLGFGVIVLITFMADFKNTVKALSEFKLIYLPLILGLTFINYLLRFVKWQFFLKQIEIEVPLKESFAIFLSGLAMTITPGKAGELLKSLMLKEIKNVAVSRSAPIIFAERLSDGFGLLILSLSGLTMFKYGWQALLAVGLIMVSLVILIKIPYCHKALYYICSNTPVIKRFVGIFENLLHSASRLLTLKALAFTIILSVISWSFECIAFYYVFVGLGYKVSILAATFTLAFSSIIGSVSMLPGGLGATEGSIMGLLVKVIGVPFNIAAVATILIRFCTLWFGVIVGLIAIASNSRLLGIVNKTDNRAYQREGPE
jgi:uncharacterized protein (TIRG00374 family)